MKIYQICSAGLLLFISIRHYTQAAHADNSAAPQKATEAQSKGLDKSFAPELFKLVLPDGTSLEFDKKLLEQAGFFKPLLDRTERMIPVAEYITHLQAKNPDELGLQNLHAILSVLSEHRDNQEEALQKLFSSQNSLTFMINLVKIAAYFEIKPLYRLITQSIGTAFAQSHHHQAFKAALTALPDEWQMDITPAATLQNKVLRDFLVTTLPSGSEGPVMAWSPDSKQLAANSVDRKFGYPEYTITLWNIPDHTIAKTLAGHTKAIYALAWSPDSTQIASACFDGTIKLWNSVTAQEIRTLQGHDYAVQSVAWSPNSAKLASAGSDRILDIWDVATGEILRGLQGHDGAPVLTVAWSPQGTIIASGSTNNTIKLWDSLTGDAIRTLRGHTGVVTAVAFSPDGRFLASSSEDKIVIIWHVATGRPLRTLRGHIARVSAISWSPDGTQLASSSYDKTIKIWDAASGKMMQTLQGYDGRVESVAWSPDGTEIAAGYSNKTIKLWPLSPHVWGLTIPQIDLLTTIIPKKRLTFSPEEKTIYDSLSQEWKAMLTQRLSNTYQAPEQLNIENVFF